MPAEHIQYSKFAPGLSTTNCIFCLNSVFCTTRIHIIYTIFRIAFRKKLCYFIVRKGDTNVQVTPESALKLNWAKDVCFF